MKIKLLVVDDEPDILKFLKSRLQRHGYIVFTAENGRRCIEVALKERPDLIILDIIMPLMDGYEAIKELRDTPLTSDIPIIMHSVRKETGSIFKSMELGSIDFVTKPVSFEDLLKVIKRYV